MKTIQCRKCKKPTLEHQFERQPTGNLIRLCPLCRIEDIKAKKKKGRKQAVKSKGLTEQQYQDMFNKQNGRCAICSILSPDRALAIDHHHGTGEVRGLLCSNCNAALGLLKDNPQFLRRAIAYLYKHGHNS